MSALCQSNKYISFYNNENRLGIKIFREGNIIEIKDNNLTYNINKSLVKINNNKTSIELPIKSKKTLVTVFNLLIKEVNKLNDKESFFFNQQIKLEDFLIN